MVHLFDAAPLQLQLLRSPAKPATTMKPQHHLDNTPGEEISPAPGRNAGVGQTNDSSAAAITQPVVEAMVSTPGPTPLNPCCVRNGYPCIFYAD